MLNRLEMIFYKLIFWGMIPLILFLAGWWSSIGLNDNQQIFSVAFAGLGFGILIDGFLLKSYLKSLETLKPAILISVYVFYSIMMLGFFMGVPVFNLFLGIFAGRFMVRVGLYHGLSKKELEVLFRNTAKIITLVMIGVCIVSALIALQDLSDTAMNIQLMFNLGFVVTPLMIIILIGLGGCVLVLFQYQLSLYVTRYNLKHIYFDPKDPFYRPIS